MQLTDLSSQVKNLMTTQHSHVQSADHADLAPGALKHTLPALPYDYAALEPYIDSHTLKLHHNQHHAGYVTNLNKALEHNPALQQHSAEWLLCNLNQAPQNIRTAIHHNAGGHVNHSLFWKTMSPAGGGTPTGGLADALKRDFGSVAQFKARFEELGEKLFGSGWVWLVQRQGKTTPLEVLITTGHDNPLMQGVFPILVNDVWEHAYYLKYKNRRADYPQVWWSVVNWQEAGRRFEACNQS